MTVTIDGASLSIEDVVSVAHGNDEVTFAPGIRPRMQAHRDVVEDVLARGDQVYGLTTGVAERKRVSLQGSARAGFNRSLLRTHRMAQGPLAPPTLVRATMLVLANAFAIGTPGVRPELAELLLEALRQRVVPAVRTLGSVGEADLGPLADLANWLVDWAGFELAENEGLALLDNNAFSTAWSALAVAAAARLLDSMDLAAALDLEAYAANLDALHPIVARTATFSWSLRVLGQAANRPRRKRALGERSRPQSAGPTHVPLCPADSRCGPRRLELHAPSCRA